MIGIRLYILTLLNKFLMTDENEILIFMDTEKIGENKCIPLSDKDYNKLKNYGSIRILITRSNTKQ